MVVETFAEVADGMIEALSYQMSVGCNDHQQSNSDLFPLDLIWNSNYPQNLLQVVISARNYQIHVAVPPTISLDLYSDGVKRSCADLGVRLDETFGRYTDLRDNSCTVQALVFRIDVERAA